MPLPAHQEAIIYLGAPYTSPDGAVVASRMETLMKVDSILSSNGIYTVSPLYKHFILQHADLPSDWAYWGGYSKSLMHHCSGLWVVVNDAGWSQSTGVIAEIALAKELGIGVRYLLLTEDEKTVLVSTTSDPATDAFVVRYPLKSRAVS